MKLELRQLRHVLALDRHRNFARAAEALGLTQPALSHSLQTLERSVGARLFDRDRSQVTPTSLGERLIARARPLLSQARDIEQDLRQALGLEVGLLRIGAGAFPADISVSTAVGRLVHRHPGLHVDLSAADWPALVERVLSGDLDIAVAETSHVADDLRLVVEPMPTHRIVFYCRAGHPLAGRTAVTLDEVRRFPLVSPSIPVRLTELANRRTLREPHDPAGSVMPEIRVETVALSHRVVLESDAISGAVMGQIEAQVAAGTLVPLPFEAPWLHTNYGIIRLASRTPGPAAEVFMRVLREVEAEIA